MWSNMGKRQGSHDPGFVCHEKCYQQAPYLGDVLVVENVPQYCPDLVQNRLGPNWTVQHVVIDPRILGLPASRPRIFMLCYKHKLVSWRKGVTLSKVLGALTSRVVADASMYLWQKLPPVTLSASKDTRQQMWLSVSFCSQTLLASSATM